ncbi:MAG: hypothetical protein O2945_07670 [Planctomycetota bacterium]|nr:hypothetical protein [Planctomycetota bacterium]
MTVTQKEAVFRDLDLKNRSLSREEAIAVMIENPTLIERPIIVKGSDAVIGRPPENVHELLQ